MWPEWPKQGHQHATSPGQHAMRWKQPKGVKSLANGATEGLEEGQRNKKGSGWGHKGTLAFFSFFTTLLTLPNRTPSPFAECPNGHVQHSLSTWRRYSQPPPTLPCIETWDKGFTHPLPPLWFVFWHDRGALNLPKPSLVLKCETGGSLIPYHPFGSCFNMTGVLSTSQNLPSHWNTRWESWLTHHHSSACVSTQRGCSQPPHTFPHIEMQDGGVGSPTTIIMLGSSSHPFLFEHQGHTCLGILLVFSLPYHKYQKCAISGAFLMFRANSPP